MTAKSKKETDENGQQVFNIGTINATHVVMRDQTNYISNIANIQNQVQFVDELKMVQARIAEIKQGQLSTAQARNLEMVEGQIIAVTDEAQKPQPALERIQASLGEAKETLELLAGSLSAAAALGVTIGGLVQLAVRLFGG
jgi:hypothetical protein